MSNSDFDPYRKWLGIPKGKRPPTHYDLLSVDIDEDDQDVIRSAAEQRRTFVEKQRGKGYEEAVTGILYQLDEAEMTLTNPELRREYDKRLKLFGKRRRKRQVDPNGLPPRVGSQPGRTVGEESGLAGQFGKIVAIIAIAFFGIAAASFYLPWSKLDERPEKQIANVDTQPVKEIDSEAAGSSSSAAATAQPPVTTSQTDLQPAQPPPLATVTTASDTPDWSVIRAHEKYVTHLDVTSNGEQFVTTSNDRTVRLWNFETGELVWRFDDESEPKEKNPLAISFAENDSVVAVITRSRFIKLDAKTGNQIETVGPFSPRLDWAVFSPDATEAIVFQNDNDQPVVKLCDTTDKTFKPLQTMNEWVPMAAISPAGEIFAGSFENAEKTFIVDPKTTAIKETLGMVGGRVVSARFSSNGSLLAIGEGTGRKSSDRPTSIIWQRKNGKWRSLHEIRQKGRWTWSLDFSPDGRYLAMGGSGWEDDWYGSRHQLNNTLRIVDVASGSVVHKYEGHHGSILDINFTPDGRHIITGGADSNIRRWPFETVAGEFKKPADHRANLIAKLAGSQWENSFGGTFEFTDDGRLLHSSNKTERRWLAVGPQEIKVVFSNDHVDSLMFDGEFKTFVQHVRDNTKDTAKGVRLAGGDRGTQPEPVAAKPIPPKKVLGRYLVHWEESSGTSGDVEYRFDPDGSVWKASTRRGFLVDEDGTWVVKFDDEKRGTVALDSVTERSFKGVHAWRSGRFAKWTARRIGEPRESSISEPDTIQTDTRFDFKSLRFQCGSDGECEIVVDSQPRVPVVELTRSAFPFVEELTNENLSRATYDFSQMSSIEQFRGSYMNTDAKARFIKNVKLDRDNGVIVLSGDSGSSAEDNALKLPCIKPYFETPFDVEYFFPNFGSGSFQFDVRFVDPESKQLHLCLVSVYGNNVEGENRPGQVTVWERRTPVAPLQKVSSFTHSNGTKETYRFQIRPLPRAAVSAATYGESDRAISTFVVVAPNVR